MEGANGLENPPDANHENMGVPAKAEGTPKPAKPSVFDFFKNIIEFFDSVLEPYSKEQIGMVMNSIWFCLFVFCFWRFYMVFGQYFPFEFSDFGFILAVFSTGFAFSWFLSVLFVKGETVMVEKNKVLVKRGIELANFVIFTALILYFFVGGGVMYNALHDIYLDSVCFYKNYSITAYPPDYGVLNMKYLSYSDNIIREIDGRGNITPIEGITFNWTKIGIIKNE